MKKLEKFEEVWSVNVLCWIENDTLQFVEKYE